MDDVWEFVTRRHVDEYDVLVHVPEDGRTPAQWAGDYLRARGVRRGDAVRRSLLDPTYGYQLLSGRRKGSRDKYLQLAVGMRLSIADTDALLEHADLSRLRPYRTRDAVVAYCLARHMDVALCDDALYRTGQASLRHGYPDL